MQQGAAGQIEVHGERVTWVRMGMIAVYHSFDRRTARDNARFDHIYVGGMAVTQRLLGCPKRVINPAFELSVGDE